MPQVCKWGKRCRNPQTCKFEHPKPDPPQPDQKPEQKPERNKQDRAKQREPKPEPKAEPPTTADPLPITEEHQSSNTEEFSTTQAETTEPSEEQWEEEDEDLFLKSLQTTPGQNNNQISKLHYAKGPRTEAVKKNPLVLMVAEKPSIALSITEALSRGKYTKGFGSKSLPVY